MLFFETSAKTSYNIDEVNIYLYKVFTTSANEIAKNIKENYYDLSNEVYKKIFEELWYKAESKYR